MAYVRVKRQHEYSLAVSLSECQIRKLKNIAAKLSIQLNDDYSHIHLIRDAVVAALQLDNDSLWKGEEELHEQNR